MPSVILALNLLKQVGGAFLHAESHGFVLGRKGYSIFEDHVWFEDRWMVASLCDE
jgi:hypothetical protein